MTDAHIPPKNYTACEEQTENIKGTGHGSNSENVTTAVNQDNALIQTANSNLTQQDLQAPVVVNNISNETQSTVQNCTQDSKIANCSKTQFLDSDTVLKYVYKKDDKVNVVLQKNKGHPKNSLKRRKRTVSDHSKVESVAASAPVIVNYKTSHPPKEREHVSERNTGSVIQLADLADFNIETLHDNGDLNKQIAEVENKYNTEDDNQLTALPPSSDESDEKEDDSRTVGKTDRESDESSERSNYRDEKIVNQGRGLESDESDEINFSKNEKVLSKPSTGTNISRESEESSYGQPISRESHESDENNDDDIINGKSASRNIDDDSEEINEKDYNRANTKSAYKNSGNDSRQNDNYRNTRKPNYQKEYIQGSYSRETDYKTNNGKNYNRADDKSVYRNRDDDGREKDYYINDRKPISQKDHTEDPESKEKDYNINNEEIIYNRDNDKSNINRGSADASREIGDYKNEKTSYDKENEKSEQPSQNSNESEEEEEIIAIMTKKNRKPKDYRGDAYINDGDKSSNASWPFKIKDVDIGDFSYERIHVNNKGVVEPEKDSHENHNTGYLPEIAPLATPNPNLNVNSEKYSIDTTDTHVRDEINEDIRKQTHINDGEVKPVVEINSDSGESDEKYSKALFKANDGDVSLETLLGVKETASDDLNEKIVVPQGEDQKGDVKQQFERIPLNYKHDDTEQKHTENVNEPKLPLTPSEANSNDESYNSGTLDVLMPQDHRYDDNLNIKFDDLTIKLPEIKLPKDILAHESYDVHDSPEPSKDNGKPKFFQYSDEYSDEKPHGETKRQQKEEEVDHDIEFDHGYLGYYGDNKNDYYTAKDRKNDDHKEEKDDNEDLYEKFVRERFGKSGSFEKRSEKLRDVRPIEQNSDLYNTLRQVLKKTENINKEAEKSGDPNAGYAWTLEYGQKL